MCLQTDVYSIYAGDYETVIYTANSDQTSLVENFLPPQFIVTFMRIYPLTWHVYPSMRVEVKACEPDGGPCDEIVVLCAMHACARVRMGVD